MKLGNLKHCLGPGQPVFCLHKDKQASATPFTIARFNGVDGWCSVDVTTDYAINMRNIVNLSTTILPIHHYVFFVLETNVIFPSSGGNVNHPRHFFTIS